MSEKIDSSGGDPQQMPGLSGVEAMVMACFALSGLAALMYQTAWMRLFSISFGTSELSIAAVLAAYMGGLALGSVVAGRYADTLKRPVHVYALLEGGIAITALLVPLLINLASWLLLQLLGLQDTPPSSADFGQTFFYLVATFLIVGLPTGLMGATLPILAHHLVRQESQIGSRIGLLYGINTAGAVAGVLIGGFYLLPELGLNGVVWVAVCLNGLIFLIARKIPTKNMTSTATRSQSIRAWDDPCWILPIMLVSGSISFVYEVLWTRLLSHVMSSSIYAFATMLATFLTGIALGGWIGGWLTRYFRSPIVLFSIIQISIGTFAGLTYYLLDSYLLSSYSTLGQFGFAAALMLPATLFIGATYPVAVRIYTSEVGQVGAGAARVYAWNTVGAIIGAIAAGFFLLPGLGFEGVARLTSLTNVALAILALCLVVRPQWQTVLPVALLFLLGLTLYQPGRPMNVINSSSIDLNEYPSEERYYAVGRSSTVLLNESRYQFHLKTNGLPEADIFFKGSTAYRNTQRWLGLLPVIARPDTESMLIIGLGGGGVLEGVPPGVSDVDVIELEQEVVNANRIISDRRTTDPLNQARVNLVVNDARNAMTLTTKKYDAIVSQPSHPWTAGASHLFTREFVRLAKEHLNEDGVFLMWMNSEYVTPDLLKSLGATVQAEFTNVRLYQPEGNTLNFIASDGPVDLEQQIAKTRRPFIDHPNHYLNNGLFDSTEVIAALLLDEVSMRAFVEDAPVSTDDKNLMATDSIADATGMLESDVFELLKDQDPLYNANSWLRRLLTDADLFNILSKVLNLSQTTRYNAIVKTFSSREFRLIGEAYSAWWNNNTALYLFKLGQAYEENNWNQTAAYLLIEDQFNALAAGTASEETVAISEKLVGEPARILDAWTHFQNKDWDALSQMDPVLEQVATNEVWYPRALELRAVWRLQTLDPPIEQLHLAREFIESANLLSWGPQYAQHRATVGKLLNDPFIYMESAIQIGISIETEIDSYNEGYSLISRETRDDMINIVDEYITAFESEFLSSTGERGEWAARELKVLRDRLLAI